jgi:competence protein ComEA
VAEAWSRLREGDSPVPALVAVAVLALVAGLIWYRAGLRQGEDLVPDVVPAAAAAASTAETSATTGRAGAQPAALVHVAGAVAAPGLYHLPAGARVADAITAAGGPAPAAEVDRLNLAAKVADGQRIAVPRRGEPAETAPIESGGAGPSGSGGEPAGPVDLNTATAAQLETLPGVGPATAARIIDQRTRQGGFKSVRDLLRVPGIGERRFAELKDRVRV